MKKLSHFLMVLSLVFVFGTICYADSYETEPNNDKSQADALESGSTIIGQCASGDDEDWFYICTSGDDLIETTFDIPDGTSRNRSWNIQIEDSNGNLLSKVAHNSGYNEPTNLKTAVTDAGIYYVKIKSYCDQPYALNVSISNPGPCPTDPPQYDVTGIWQMAGQQYFLSLYVTGSTAIAVTYIPGAGESYMLGTITGNTGRVTYASDLAEFDATFIFTSATTGTMTVNKCAPFPGDYCILPAGTSVSGKKIF